MVVGCAACLVYGRTTDSKENFVKRMTILILLASLSSYIWNVSHQFFGMNPTSTLGIIITQVSFTILLISEPLIYWYFAYKYWITSMMLRIEGTKEYREMKRRRY